MKWGGGKRDQILSDGGGKRRRVDSIGGTDNEVELGLIAKWANSNKDLSGRNMQQSRWKHWLRQYENTGVGRKDARENDCCKTSGVQH